LLSDFHLVRIPTSSFPGFSTTHIIVAAKNIKQKLPVFLHDNLTALAGDPRTISLKKIFNGGLTDAF